MNTRLWIAVIAIVVLGGGSVAYVMYRSSNEETAAREAVLRSVEAELGALDLDRDSSLEALKDVRRLVDSVEEGATPHPDLLRAQARLQLALGRGDQAWETIGPMATAPGASPEDLWIGARVAAQLHAQLGDAARGSEALGLARQAADALDDPGAAFLAWQLAYRTDAVQAWLDLGKTLVERHGGVLEGETAQALRHFLGLHLTTRLGVPADPERLKDVASKEAGSELGALCSFVLETADESAALEESTLGQLQRQWGEAPAELMLIVARAELGKGHQTENRELFESAVAMLQEVLSRTPTSVEARHLISLAHYALHEKPQEAAHLRWLLKHAPAADVRRELWRSHL